MLLTTLLSTNSQAENLIDDVTLRPNKSDFNVVIEIPAGTNEKWEASKITGQLKLSHRNGKKRVIKYIAYPFNYGFFPQTRLGKKDGGDGDPLDVVVLGSSIPRGNVVKVRPVAVLSMRDRDEVDDKIIAVPVDSEIFTSVKTFAQLKAYFKGIDEIVKIFFENYKGPGLVVTRGWLDEADSVRLINRAARGFRKEIKSKKL